MLAAVLCATALFRAAALDVEEVMDMLQNGVRESVVINMLEQRKLSRPLDAREVIRLSRAGASPQLLEALTDIDNIESAHGASAPTIVEPAPVPVAANPPTVIVAAPPPVVYSYPRTYYHMEPYPYYSRPGYSFGFSFGSRWGRPHHRPHRPGPGRHPGRPGRPGGHGPPGHRPPGHRR
jgi:hypothetical protein